MRVRKPEFRLISKTELPLESIFAVWVQSRPTQFPEIFAELRERGRGGVVTAGFIAEGLMEGFVNKEKFFDTIRTITKMDLPITESVHFTWGFTALPIEWREQAVRKRQWGFWLTSMREFTMEDFADDGRFCPPPDGTVSPESMDRFYEMINTIQGFYCELQSEWNWPPEKARKVIPLSATHNGTMFSNLRTLLNTVSSRTCWIAQLDIWAPVLAGMVNDLRDEHYLLGQIISPPCFDRYSNEFKGCKYEGICENRCSGEDMYAPCPIYAYYSTKHKIHVVGDTEDYTRWCEKLEKEQKFIQDAIRLIPLWAELWGRDPFTGKLL